MPKSTHYIFYIHLMLSSITVIFLVYIFSSIVMSNITGKETVFLIINQCDYQAPISTVLNTMPFVLLTLNRAHNSTFLTDLLRGLNELKYLIMG